MFYGKALEAVMSSVAIVIISILLITTIFQFKRLATSAASDKFTIFMWTFIMTGILYLFYNIFKFYTSIAPDSHISSPFICQIYWQSYDFYLIGKLLMYLFYCHRVYDTFKTSTFELSFTNYKILLISVSVYYIGIALAFAIECAQWQYKSLYPLPDTITTDNIETWSDCVLMADFYVLKLGFVIKIVLLFLGETIFAVILLRLYVRKVLLVTNLSTRFNYKTIEVSMNSIRSVPSGSGSGSKNQSKTSQTSTTQSVSDIDDVFLQIAVKSTNLVIFSIITSIVTAVLFDAIGRWLLEFDTIVNFLCMYLTFAFAKKPYGIICYGTHKCCWNICVQSCFKCCMNDCCKCECECVAMVKGNKDEQELTISHIQDAALSSTSSIAI